MSTSYLGHLCWLAGTRGSASQNCGLRLQILTHIIRLCGSFTHGGVVSHVGIQNASNTRQKCAAFPVNLRFKTLRAINTMKTEVLGFLPALTVSLLLSSNLAAGQSEYCCQKALELGKNGTSNWKAVFPDMDKWNATCGQKYLGEHTSPSGRIMVQAQWCVENCPGWERTKFSVQHHSIGTLLLNGCMLTNG